MSEISAIQTFEDFKSFLLICAASSDHNISKEEHDFIVRIIPEKRYVAIKRIVDRCSDFECMNIIAEHKDKFVPDEAARKDLINDLLALFNSDHNYSTLERNMFLALKKIL